ncbi:MAG TPA: Rne/Rng family ribonuclease [Acidimicrobiales bacterium]|nr:Rne/Rng family ribonuclease [Acidimicrobiales bacterium]
MSESNAGMPVREPEGSPPTASPPDPGGERSRPATAQPERSRAPGADGSAGSSGDGEGNGGSGAGGPATRSGARRRRRRRSSAGKSVRAEAPEEEGEGPASGEDAEVLTAQAMPAPPVGPPPHPASPPAPAPAAVPRPRIGDSRPAPTPPRVVPPVVLPPVVTPARAPSGSAASAAAAALRTAEELEDEAEEPQAPKEKGRSRRRSGRERRGRPVGRYLMCVHVRPHATQIAVLEGRTLVEHYVSRVADDTTQIDGNIYRGRVQNVLPGMEAAFIDIGTPKNAVLYRGDVRYDRDDIESPAGATPRIEQMLRPGQTILCQVTKNPIGAKGARLTQEVSLPGRFVVLVPNSNAFGISKRLDDTERRRLRRIVDDVRPAGHGLIVRTAAEGASREELSQDIARLGAQWEAIAAEAARGTAPGLLYREPDLAVRIVREEFNREYRGVVIDDPVLYAQVHDYVRDVNPELVDRVELYDPEAEQLPLFERFHVHEQLHKALDRKVWLPSGGSLIIERTEALTVIDVNTGKNVGKSNLEETVFRNNLEAAEEIARQLRLRDIGGIIVIDFIDMEIRDNRDKVAAALRSALARDKTRTQVFDISELGLVEMTRKRISEGLVEALSTVCPMCEGRGIVLDESLL